MLELARYEARHRVRGTAALAAGLVAYAALVVWLYPSLDERANLEALAEAYPESILRAFGFRTFATFEGFLGVEFYALAWVILLGLYFAYAGANLVAADAEAGRLDVLLSLPVSRSRLLAEKFAALAVPLVTVNVVTPIAIYAGARLIDAPLAIRDLVAVHALSTPYLLACAGIGLLASVAFDRAGVAQRTALGAVFGLFLLDSAVADTDYAVVGMLAPMRYFDPNAILVDGTADFASAGLLLAAAAGLVLASAGWFRRKDIP